MRTETFDYGLSQDEIDDRNARFEYDDEQDSIRREQDSFYSDLKKKLRVANNNKATSMPPIINEKLGEVVSSQSFSSGLDGIRLITEQTPNSDLDASPK